MFILNGYAASLETKLILANFNLFSRRLLKAKIEINRGLKNNVHEQRYQQYFRGEFQGRMRRSGDDTLRSSIIPQMKRLVVSILYRR